MFLFFPAVFNGAIRNSDRVGINLYARNVQTLVGLDIGTSVLLSSSGTVLPLTLEASVNWIVVRLDGNISRVKKNYNSHEIQFYHISKEEKNADFFTDQE